MANIFDRMRDGMVRVVHHTMGYDAVWTPSSGGPSQTARVLFNEPTEPQNNLGVEYGPTLPWIDYHTGAFQGLYESVRNGAIEVVGVVGRTFVVREVRKAHDGDTYIAKLEEQ